MNVPPHCLENAIFFSKGDYMNFNKVSTGAKTSLEFNKIPEFYKINDEQCFAVEYCDGNYWKIEKIIIQN